MCAHMQKEMVNDFVVATETDSNSALSLSPYKQSAHPPEHSTSTAFIQDLSLL